MLTQEWTLSVRDFGPIKTADVTTAPLMVFAGRNSTGKSHLASLFWELSDADLYGRLTAQPLTSELCTLANDLFPKSFDDRSQIEVGTETREALAAALSELFREKRDAIVSTLFAAQKTIGDLFVSTKETDKLTITYTPMRQDRLGITFSRPSNKLYSIHRSSTDAQLHLGFLIYHNLFSSKLAFLPAARTGLILSLKSILARSLETSLGLPAPGQPSAPTAIFPKPTVAFLQDLVRSSGANDDYLQKDATRTEQEILGGEIIRRSTEVPDFAFRLEGSTGEFPLHTASSIVTELAPFILLMKSGALNNGFIFEEPEAHLHLEAQRALARALARLLNRGVPMILTTHSDTFLQQINILMWLYRHPKRDKLMAELGYQEDELINPEMVRGYHFEPQADGTHVAEMEKRPQGLVVPSMNKTIRDLRKEIIALQKDDE